MPWDSPAQMSHGQSQQTIFSSCGLIMLTNCGRVCDWIPLRSLLDQHMQDHLATALHALTWKACPVGQQPSPLVPIPGTPCWETVSL